MMEKPLAPLPFIVSALLLGLGISFTSSAHENEQLSAKLPQLTIEDAGDPAKVTERLSIGIRATTDENKAKEFFALGRKAQKNRNWSLASKAFGESLVRSPTPQALSEYADSEIRMLGAIRLRTQSHREYALRDLSYVLAYYRSAIAADTVVGTLKPGELNDLRRAVACVNHYVETQQSPRDCPPLKKYGLNAE